MAQSTSDSEFRRRSTMVQTKEKSPAKSADVYLERFSHFEREASQPKWLLPIRKAGLARFGELGLPTLHDEDWRFTNIAPIAKLPFKPAFVPTDGVSADALKDFAFAKLPGSRLVFVNGHCAPIALVGQQSSGRSESGQPRRGTGLRRAIFGKTPWPVRAERRQRFHRTQSSVLP
jgi:hypothetical protein